MCPGRGPRDGARDANVATFGQLELSLGYRCHHWLNRLLDIGPLFRLIWTCHNLRCGMASHRAAARKTRLSQWEETSPFRTCMALTVAESFRGPRRARKRDNSWNVSSARSSGRVRFPASIGLNAHAWISHGGGQSLGACCRSARSMYRGPCGASYDVQAGR